MVGRGLYFGFELLGLNGLTEGAANLHYWSPNHTPISSGCAEEKCKCMGPICLIDGSGKKQCSHGHHGCATSAAVDSSQQASLRNNLLGWWVWRLDFQSGLLA
ncbi:unnamed protein product [Linum tenue]|uniref:Uncharacterized protein n=1 Tax=Linum tenue TaxID=586396 RepID=A0AAV0IE02_9ROSI|nr:unnamed protein product [Linum tenue]